MLGRLQQGLVAFILMIAALWWFLSSLLGWSEPARWLVLMLILLPHAALLALEFICLARWGHTAPVTPATPWQMFRAWSGEVVTGVAVFAWRQPFRARAVPDHVDPIRHAGRTGAVLVHGFVCNRGLWNPWLRRLRRAGLPCIAVNLEPVFGSIESYSRAIEDAVSRLQLATGRPPLIVAHSMGGLAARAWLREYASDARVHSVITVGTPHQGTWLGRFALSTNGRQMRQDSPWLADLSSAETPARRALFTCYFGHCDNIVFPTGTATLAGADNRHLAALAHVRMLFEPIIFNEIQHRMA